ncbi:MAG: alpha/beta hydrolase [Chromatiales bacterium]|jgi:acetyl esterase/lipase|nr:alpha/beta hydrolase [Chromatiales bacterium]
MMSPSDYVNLAPARADQRANYGDDPQQYGDLYLPECESATPYPVVIILHGGCWQSRYDSAPLGQLARALTGHGLAAWNLEYRRIGNGGGWPNTFLDVQAGVEALHTLAGTVSLDLTRVIALGHSAGGHLALWLAGAHHLPGNSPIAAPRKPIPLCGVVSLAGIADLALANQLGVCSGAAATLLDGEYDAKPDRYRHASPSQLLPLQIPHHHIFGADDKLVSPQGVQGFIEEAQRLGDNVRLELIPDCGHFEPVTAGSAAWPQVESALLALLMEDG